MTKKINPISLRLGLSQVWEIAIQSYGKFNSCYVKFIFKQLQIEKTINRIIYSNKFLIHDQEFWYIENKLLLNIYFTELSTNHLDKYLSLIKKLSKVIFNWFLVKICIKIYKRTNLITTTNLITNYALYLFAQNKNPNKVLWQICLFLKKHLNSYKIVYSTRGIRLIYLKGFKVRIVGRFDNTKSQMAKSIQQSSGPMSLVSLKNHVEFIQETLYTKLGSCGLQIWLFYEID